MNVERRTADDDVAARGARAAARRLESEFGARITGDVEAVLREGNQHVDPAVVANLIISAAEQTWAVYLNFRSGASQQIGSLSYAVYRTSSLIASGSSRP